MANSKISRTQELGNLLGATVDSFLSATDEEILAEIAERGLNRQQVAASVQEALQRAEAVYRKSLREDALQRWKANTQSVENKLKITLTSPEKRGLFERALAAFGPAGTGMLTMQHRELKDYTDSDIEQALLELAALGVLNDMQADESD